ncbi:MAG: hypothetical protein IAC55_02375 [Tyzzerella sp.]|uniref:Uncharacterized protein n=1 Tax=Candidatus Fimicola merdigallinarum TaxID=2840819 RepID=A0A9D9DV06_9FIRM|nr:hypothetical protein [Candidatus Fimicola merdigallinarum]
MEKDKYSSQKKYLAKTKKQLRVWVDAEKYERLKDVVKKNDTSIYALVNKYIEEYLKVNS